MEVPLGKVSAAIQSPRSQLQTGFSEAELGQARALLWRGHPALPRPPPGPPRPEKTGGGVEHGEVVASKREDDPKPLCLEPNPVCKQGRAVPDLLLEMHSHGQNHPRPRYALTSARLSFGRKYVAPKQRLLLGRRWW